MFSPTLRQTNEILSLFKTIDLRSLGTILNLFHQLVKDKYPSVST